MRPNLHRLRTGILVLLLSASMLPAKSQIKEFIVEDTPNSLWTITSTMLAGNRMAILGWDDYVTLSLNIYDANGAKVSYVNLDSKLAWTHSYRPYTEFRMLGMKNGNIFLAYWSTSNSAGMTTLNARFVILNAAGDIKASGQLNSIDAGTDYLRDINLASLSDGKVVAVWRRQQLAHAAFRIFNPDGSALGADVPFAGNGTATPLTSIYSVKLAAGKNGNFVAMLFSYNSHLRAFIYNNNGVNALATPSLAVDPTVTGSSYYLNNIAGLSNGNFVLSWWRGSSLYHKIITSTGATATETATLSVNNVHDIFPVHDVGNEGYFVAEYLGNSSWDPADPYASIMLHRYSIEGTLLSSSSVPGGTLIQPDYIFMSGLTGGIAMVYSYYKSFWVDFDPWMGTPGSYFLDSDVDTRAALVNISLSTLPVELVSYSATLLNDQSVKLEWKTSSESNNSHFEIEKSENGINYRFLGRVNGAGTSATENRYAFTDQPINTKSFYRLRQVDIDGRSKDLGVRMVQPAAATRGAAVYPNPVQGNAMTIYAGTTKLPSAWQLHDATGKVVKSGTLKQSQETVDISGLSSGIYFLKIENNTTIRIRK